MADAAVLNTAGATRAGSNPAVRTYLYSLDILRKLLDLLRAL